MARKKTTRKNLRSTPAFDEPWSRNEAILQNILGASNTLVDPQSRIEAILQAILYGTAYTDEPQSRIEELLIAWLNAYIEKTVTGNPITVNDAVAQNVMALLAELVPAQDLHGYSEPWPSGGHYNRWNEEWEEGAYATTDGRPVSASQVRSKADNPIPVVGGESYCFVCTSARISQIYWYDENDVFISNTSNASDSAFVATAPSNATFCRFQCPSAYGTTYKNDVAVNYPSTVTTYSPYSNICPITGNTGVTVQRTDGDGQNPATVSVTFPALGANQWDEEWEEGAYSSENGTKVNVPNRIRNKNLISVAPDATYYFVKGSWGTISIYQYDKDKQYLTVNNLGSTQLFTTPENCYYIAFNTGVNSGSTYTNDISINYPSTVTTYEPYTNTVYGGEVDFTTGVLTITRVTKDLGDCTWTKAANANIFYTISLARANKNTAGAKYICSEYPYRGLQSGNAGAYDKGDISLTVYNGPDARVWIRNDSMWSLTTTQFKSAMSGVQLVYELATPQTIQLTPQTLAMLAGTNILQSAEADDLSLTYKATN